MDKYKYSNTVKQDELQLIKLHHMLDGFMFIAVGYIISLLVFYLEQLMYTVVLALDVFWYSVRHMMYTEKWIHESTNRDNIKSKYI